MRLIHRAPTTFLSLYSLGFLKMSGGLAKTNSTGQKQTCFPSPARLLSLMNLIHYCITDGMVNMVSLTSFLLNILVNDDSKVINCERTSPP